jgi:hypothetical protein
MRSFVAEKISSSLPSFGCEIGWLIHGYTLFFLVRKLLYFFKAKEPEQFRFIPVRPWILKAELLLSTQ